MTQYTPEKVAELVRAGRALAVIRDAKASEERTHKILTDREPTREDSSQTYAALMHEGIYGQKALDVVSAMQNEGILFRERKAGKAGPWEPVPASPTREEPNNA